MNPYMVFGYCNYYPGGGTEDFINDFETFEEAVDFIFNEIYKRDDFHENYEILHYHSGTVYSLEAGENMSRENIVKELKCSHLRRSSNG